MACTGLGASHFGTIQSIGLESETGRCNGSFGGVKTSAANESLFDVGVVVGVRIDVDVECEASRSSMVERDMNESHSPPWKSRLAIVSFLERCDEGGREERWVL